MATADHWRHIASSTEVAPGILAMSHDERSYAGKQPSRRSANVTMAVDGSRLQTLRQQAGMTQEQLATATGFSDRLIRKAEASAPLRQTTISTIAQALSKRGRPVTVADLVLSQKRSPLMLSRVCSTDRTSRSMLLRQEPHPNSCCMSWVKSWPFPLPEHTNRPKGICRFAISS